MVRRLTIIAAFLFFLMPVVSFAQNNCITWVCYYPPDGCAYCDTTNDGNANSRCERQDDWSACLLTGFCDTGLGGCTDEFSCAHDVFFGGFWIRLSPPRSLRDEWQLVDVSVRRKAVHHLRRS
jgi:hypothetical protein